MRPIESQLPSLASLLTTRQPRPTHPVTAPFTGKEFARVPYSNAEDVAFAVERARNAQIPWSATPHAQRRRIFLRFHDLLLRNRETLLDLLQLEGGKARRTALEEVLDTAINARYYAWRAENWLKSQNRRGAFPLLTQTQVHYHPLGVVGVISAWNYPLTLGSSDSVPALLAGNTVVLKCPERTPFSSLLVKKLLQEAGLPADVFQVVTGGPETGSALVKLADGVQFTGSTPTGRIVAQAAAARLIPYSLELGGKNPVIVLADADLGRAVEGVLRGAFSNVGQLCVSTERLYVQRGIYAQFVQKLVEEINSLCLGSSYDFSTQIGSLLSQDQLEKTQSHVCDALEKGAHLLAGGRARPDLGPFFYEPALLEGVTPAMQVYAEETFGPVLAVYPFDTPEEAVRMANDSPYGLTASIWSRNRALAKKIAKEIRAGSVNINEAFTAAWASVDAPQGGLKQSGGGWRHGPEGLLKYVQPQTVAVHSLLPLTYLKGISPLLAGALIVLYIRLIKNIPGLR